MMRILLFLVTNIAVMVVISILFSVFGVGQVLDANGVDLDLGKLLIYSAIIGFTGSIISLLISKPMAKWQTGAKIVNDASDPDSQWLVSRVRAHAEAAGIGMPDVAIFPADAPNAFATGARRDSALVAVSTGLLRGMKRNEIDAVLGHEIAHIANGDMITLTLIQGVVNTFVVFLSRIVGHIVDRVILKNERGHGIGFLRVLAGGADPARDPGLDDRRLVLATPGVSRRRRGCPLCGQREHGRGARALKRGVAPLPDGMAAFGIGGGGMLALFSTHPPLDVRIAALRANRG